MNKADKLLLQRIGFRIASIRKDKGFTQVDLCYEAELDVSTLSRLERGELNFTIQTLIKISEVLGVDPKDFF